MLDSSLVAAVPLTPEAFAPFGQVLRLDIAHGRQYFDADLGGERSGARPSISVIQCDPVQTPRITVDKLERHSHSSQSFIPIAGGRYLVVVAPAGSVSTPDLSAVRAFIAQPSQGVTYRQGTWHRHLTVLDVAARHVIFMWRDGTSADEEFASVSPFDVLIPTQHP